MYILVYKLEHMNDKRGQNKRKYSLNNGYFSKLTEQSCYWLGVMYADGNVSTNEKNSTGKVILSSTDKEWLKDFSNTIEYTGPIREEIHKKFKKSIWKITISSRKMYDDLVDLGCVPRKSLVIIFPDLPKDMIPHFIRGYFDGDGSVTVCRNLTNSKWKILKSSFCSGSGEFLKVLSSKLPVKNKNYYKGKRIFELKYSLNDTISLYNYMYKDSTICLERKYSKFKEYIDNYQPRGSSETTISQLI